jgi:hypothetical protein
MLGALQRIRARAEADKAAAALGPLDSTEGGDKKGMLRGPHAEKQQEQGWLASVGIKGFGGIFGGERHEHEKEAVAPAPVMAQGQIFIKNYQNVEVSLLLSPAAVPLKKKLKTDTAHHHPNAAQ